MGHLEDPEIIAARKRLAARRISTAFTPTYRLKPGERDIPGPISRPAPTRQVVEQQTGLVPGEQRAFEQGFVPPPPPQSFLSNIIGQRNVPIPAAAEQFRQGVQGSPPSPAPNLLQSLQNAVGRAAFGTTGITQNIREFFEPEPFRAPFFDPLGATRPIGEFVLPGTGNLVGQQALTAPSPTRPSSTTAPYVLKPGERDIPGPISAPPTTSGLAPAPPDVGGGAAFPNAQKLFLAWRNRAEFERPPILFDEDFLAMNPDLRDAMSGIEGATLTEFMRAMGYTSVPGTDKWIRNSVAVIPGTSPRSFSESVRTASRGGGIRPVTRGPVTRVGRSIGLTSWRIQPGA